MLLTQTCKTIHFHSFMKHKLRYFWWNMRAFWPCIDWNATETFKVQKGSKYIVNIVHVTSMVQFYEGMRIPFFVHKSKQKLKQFLLLCVSLLSMFINSLIIVRILLFGWTIPLKWLCLCIIHIHIFTNKVCIILIRKSYIHKDVVLNIACISK